MAMRSRAAIEHKAYTTKITQVALATLTYGKVHVAWLRPQRPARWRKAKWRKCKPASVGVTAVSGHHHTAIDVASGERRSDALLPTPETINARARNTLGIAVQSVWPLVIASISNSIAK